MGASLPLGHGVNTGQCIPTDGYFYDDDDEEEDKQKFSCEVLAWCPIEKDVKPLGDEKALLEAAENFTVLIKNQVTCLC